ncbi:oligosaccharide flippase family protein [Ruegeria sp. R14_0]|uniref:oligosaccharide flippase family protein n=1 Tax=Ruegeria sp. R14_0 TaxID=2821100 RepID=UPI001ADD33EE|nr:oligosaccharide flippase family protein [Ruegeria sp. R14_0]MBO9446644.1 oligosaccharide flippase family protein [Ruegeria sp. R14_0]
MISRILKARRGLIVLGLKGLEALIGATMTIVLARLLGPMQFGVFAFGLATITLLVIPIKNGASTLVTKHVAIARQDSDPRLAGGLLVAGFRLSALYSGLLIAGLWVAVWLQPGSEAFLTSVACFSFALPFLCAIGLAEGVMRGSFRPNSAILVGTILIPLLVLGLTIAFESVSQFQNWRIATGFYVASAATTCFLSLFLIRNDLRGLAAKASQMSDADWIAHVAPFALVTGLLVFNRQIDVILLGILAGEAEAGIYRIAAQAAVLVTFGVQAIGHLYAPYLAAADGNSTSENVSGYLRKSVLFSLGFGGSALVGLTVWGEQIISILAGPEYLPGYPIMLILCAANLAVAANGATMQALYMQGHQRTTACIFAGAGVCSVIANLTLIPLLGMTGAALATSGAIVLWSLGLRLLACRTWNLSFWAFSSRTLHTTPTSG